MKILRLTAYYLTFFGVLFALFEFFKLPGDRVAGVVTAAVGYIALLVYALGRSNELENAAKIIVLDIRNAESAVDGVKTHDTPQSWFKVIWPDNTWAKYKHLFVGELNPDEFKLVDQFFHNWAGLARTREDAFAFKAQALVAKAAAGSNMLVELDRNDPNFKQLHSNITKRIDDDDWLFQPADIIMRSKIFLNALDPISGTVAFSKLLKIARLDVS